MASTVYLEIKDNELLEAIDLLRHRRELVLRLEHESLENTSTNQPSAHQG